MTALEKILSKKYKTINELESDLGILLECFLDSGYFITYKKSKFYLIKSLPPTK